MSSVLDQTIDQLREVADRLREQLAAELSREREEGRGEGREEASERARVEAGRDVARQAADCARAIRSETSVTGVASALVSGAARFCGRAALFIHRGEELLGFRLLGATEEDAARFAKLNVAVADAPAAARALAGGAAVEAAASPEELSAAVVDVVGWGPEQRARLYPVLLRDRALALLCCDAGDETAAAATETLVALAEAWIEAVGSRKK